MKYFLIVYDRSLGKRLELRQFGTKRAVALVERFSLEESYRDNPDIEIVVLGADSLEALKKTHGRYFKSLREQWQAFE